MKKQMITKTPAVLMAALLAVLVMLPHEQFFSLPAYAAENGCTHECSGGICAADQGCGHVCGEECGGLPPVGEEGRAEGSAPSGDEGEPAPAVIFTIIGESENDSALYLAQGVPVDESGLLRGVTAVDENGAWVAVAVKDAGGLDIQDPQPPEGFSAYTVIYEATHPVTEERFTAQREVFVAAKAPAAQDEALIEEVAPLAVAGAFDITPAYGWTYASNVLTVTQSGSYTIKMKAGVTQTTTDRIVIDPGVTSTITLAGVVIDRSATDYACAMYILTSGDTKIILADGADNTLKSGKDYAGLHKNLTAGTLTIVCARAGVAGHVCGAGCGKLAASGGLNGAGIGGGWNNGDVSNITISGGIITATGYGSGAGIGSGYDGNCSNITISGGTVTATAKDGAGIGSGWKGDGINIIVSGGTVTAAADYGAGIGGGWSGNGSYITISGGTVAADGHLGAGIGGGDMRSGSNITISGGAVTATGLWGAGIGGGSYGDGSNITISGGTVTASSIHGSDIGSGLNSSATSGIVITGGSVNAGKIGDVPKNAGGAAVVRTTATLQGVSAKTAINALTAAAAPDYGIYGMQTDTAGRLFLWLPAGAEATRAVTPRAVYSGSVPAGASGTLNPSSALSKPASPKAASAGYNSVKVSWVSVPCDGYQVYRSVDNVTFYIVKTVKGGGTFAYTDPGLATGLKHYYKIRAYGSITGTKKYSAYTAAVSATPVPAKPASPAASSGGYNSVKVSWAKVAGAGGYEIHSAASGGAYKPAKTVTSGATVSFTHTGLTAGKTYSYKIRAYRTVNGVKVYGGFSAVANTKPVPAKPGSPKAASAGYSSIKASWAAVPGASGYEVCRAEASGGPYQLLKTVNGATLSYTHTGLVTGTVYYYKIRAYRTVSGTKVYGAYTAEVKAEPVPAKPTGVTAKKAWAAAIEVRWAKVGGASGYEIWRTDKSGGTYTLAGTLTGGAVVSYVESGLVTGKTYYYKIRAYRIVSGVNVYGPYSGVASFKI